MRSLVISGLAALVLGIAAAQAEPIKVVAAENVYGDVAQQIGGPNVTVTSILGNPNQDPHEFEASASTARQVADARLVIYNGADYDPWLPKLLSASRAPSRKVIEVAQARSQACRRQPARLVRRRRRSPRWQGARRHAVDARSRASDRYADAARGVRERPCDRSPIALPSCASEFAGTCGHRHRAGLRLYGGRARAQDAQRPLSARGDERHRAEPQGHRRIREGPEDATGQGADLQQPDQQRAGRAHADDRDQAGVPVVGVSETAPPGMTYQQWMTVATRRARSCSRRHASRCSRSSSTG